MIEFREATAAEVADFHLQWQMSDEQEAERARLVAECAAAHDGHAWQLELSHPEDGAGVTLACEHCPAGVQDVYMVDGNELIGVEFDGVTVQDGRHDSPVPLVVPVTVDVWSGKYWTDYGYEYDSEIQVEPRGPAREVTE